MDLLRADHSITGNIEDLARLPERSVVKVQYHSGCTYAERPVSFIWQNVVYVLQEIEEEWREPDGKYFRVRAETGEVFDLHYNGQEDEWSLKEHTFYE